VAESVEKSILNNRFPLLISGDHASAGGTLHGLKNSFPEARIGVVWIDAHADLHSPYTTPSGNLHGMPLATALGVDNLHAQRNHVDIETSLKWNQLKSNSLKFQDLVYVAVRSTEPEEDAVIEAENIMNYTVSSVRKTGVQAILTQIFSQLQNCDFIYVSFDVDSMDPIETSYGTGTPVADGLSVSEARQLLIGLCSSSKLAALEFVEVNPTLEDKKNRMAEVALDLITHCTRTLVESWK
jgi:arginase